MLRQALVFSAGAFLTAFCLVLIVGHYADEGQIILQFSSSHGVHEGDLFIAAGWALGMVLLCILGQRRSRRPFLRHRRHHRNGS
jgi:hypothetical protein